MLNPRSGRSTARSSADDQLRGHIDLREDPVWSQSGPIGAARDVGFPGWQAPVVVTSASMIRTPSPSTPDRWEPPGTWAATCGLRQHVPRASTFAPARVISAENTLAF